MSTPTLREAHARSVAFVADAIERAVGRPRWRIVIVDAGGHDAAWIDDTGRPVNVRWLAATFATEDQARAAMVRSKRDSQLTAGYDWFVARDTEPLAPTERALLIEYRRTSLAGDRRERPVSCRCCGADHWNLRIDVCDPCADGVR